MSNHLPLIISIMQMLFIKNFGPIVKADIIVDDLMVFIGPQASGKSTIAKTIYLFKSLKEDLNKYIVYTVEGYNNFDAPLVTFKSKLRNKLASFWGVMQHSSPFSIGYHYGNQKEIQLIVSRKKGYVKPIFSPNFEIELNNIFNEATDFLEKYRSANSLFATPSERMTIGSETKAFYKHIQTLINTLFEDDRVALYIPAGRNLLSTISDLDQKILGTNHGEQDKYLLDYSLQEFIAKTNNLKRIFHQDFESIIKDKIEYTNETIDHESLRGALDIFDRILKGRYHFDENGGKIRLKNTEEFVKLSFASSGQQEVIWILLHIFITILNRTKVFMVIEEPEAHLFPVAQKDMVELICLLSNLNNNQVILTTHSPYILSSLNNFIYAGKLGKSKPIEVAKFVSKKSWILPEKVAAFYIEDGKLTNIIDEELQLIKAEEIDKASSMINEQFNHLFELDLP